MSENSLTIGSEATDEELPADSRKDFARRVEIEFNHDGSGNYQYKEAPTVTAFTDHGDRISSEANEPSVVRAMVNLAASKGWANYVTKGDALFYTNVQTESENVLTELDQARHNASAEQTSTPPFDESMATLRAQAESMKQPDNTVSGKPDTSLDTEAVERERAELARRVAQSYEVNGNRYMFRNSNGKPPVEAFRDRGDSLSTTFQDEKTASDLIKLTVAKGWTDIKVTGHKTFRRNVWAQAQEYGLHVLGYEPSAMDLAAVARPANEVKRDVEAENNRARVLKAVGAAVATDRIKDPESRLKTIEAINERIDSRHGQLPDVPLHDEADRGELLAAAKEHEQQSKTQQRQHENTQELSR